MPMSVVPASTIRAALDRMERGVAVDVDDAEALLQAQGPELDRLLLRATELRDEGLRLAGRPGVITFSKKVFLPVTTLCRDRCHYCIFVDTPGQLNHKGLPAYMSPERILAVARQGAAMGCKEALFTLGDRPEERWPEARAWLDEHGYASTLEYVRAMAELVRRETGLLPHLNPGVMSLEEMEWLRPVAPSMGMMLETTSVRLWSEKGQVHFGSPDKEPAVRLGVIEDAGRARVPLTTGVLVGIGESYRERAESLFAIREAHRRHGHVQETIVQNFRAKPATAMRDAADLATTEYLAAVAVARIVMGADARIQAPPNLSEAGELGLLLRAGVDDWGGISPLTADHVNPERPWPQLDDLYRLTAELGFQLRERLTVHPPYIAEHAEWIDDALMADVERLAEKGTMLAGAQERAVRVPRGLAVRTDGVRSALRLAESAPDELTDGDLARLLVVEGDELDALAEIANAARRDTVGEAVSFVVNRNLSSQRIASSDGDAVPFPDGVAAVAVDAWELGATELCVQGIAPAAAPDDIYLAIARTVKTAAPQLHLHAFRPADIVDGARRSGMPLADFALALRDAGVDTVPGTGVKILDESVRRRIAPDDLPIEGWIEAVTAAHRAGLRSSAVMFYGHVETAAQRVAHLRALARIQDETGGFTEFVPMPLPGRPLRGLVRGRSERDEHRAMHAVARLALGGRIRHQQASWPRLGPALAADALAGGADDLGGTLLGGRVHAGAGAEAGRELGVAEIERLAQRLFRPTRQRTTVYGEPTPERKAARG